jgi:hypothetical protein
MLNWSLKKVLLSISLLITLQSVSFGQSLPIKESEILSTSLQRLTRLYDQSLGSNSRLYNGIKFIDPYEGKAVDGFPYYLVDDWQIGSIQYDNQFYDKIDLLFDIAHDHVIVESAGTNQKIQLISEKIQSFIINNQLFVRLQSPDAGFYRQVYSGELKIYAKYYKTVQEKMDDKSIITEFLSKRRLYIVKNKIAHTVTSKASALKVLRENKGEINKFLKKENISFKQDKEYALLKMAEYYDQLNAGK